jgi:hypothetical protein
MLHFGDALPSEVNRDFLILSISQEKLGEVKGIIWEEFRGRE